MRLAETHRDEVFPQQVKQDHFLRVRVVTQQLVHVP